MDVVIVQSYNAVIGGVLHKRRKRVRVATSGAGAVYSLSLSLSGMRQVNVWPTFCTGLPVGQGSRD